MSTILNRNNQLEEKGTFIKKLFKKKIKKMNNP